MYLGTGTGKNPEGAPPARSRYTEVCCTGCRTWFQANHFICPYCQEPRPGYNSTLRTTRINNHLLAQAEQARRDA